MSTARRAPIGGAQNQESVPAESIRGLRKSFGVVVARDRHRVRQLSGVTGREGLTFPASDHDRQRTSMIFEDRARDNVNAWIEWMSATKKYAPRTVTLRLTALRSFLAFSAAEDLTLIATSQAIAEVKPSRITSPRQRTHRTDLQ